jgi:Icc-related predicted phosphoesterase
MGDCFFVSDLHGRKSRYLPLFARIAAEKPEAVFLGGDLFPGLKNQAEGDFLEGFFAPGMARLKAELGSDYPRVFLILGNDDSKLHEEGITRWMEEGNLWEYIHNRSVEYGAYRIYGYNYVPPTPFFNKDWERYDISRYVDPGCIPPEEGWHSSPEPLNEIEHGTIQKDLLKLGAEEDLSQAVFLFHTPPYQTKLDRAALDGKIVDHAPLDLHVGSIAVKEFILDRQPWLTLHGHVHESPHLTGAWKDQLGNTVSLSAAHGGPELALVRFRLEEPAGATRELIPPDSG